MKVNLNIQAAPHASFFCVGWVENEKTDPLLVKVGNRAIAGWITGRMPCRMELPNGALLEGNIRRTGNDDDFIVEKQD